MHTIGITGGVGAGKSRIIDYIRQTFKAPVIVADELAHYLEEPGQPCYNELVSEFGNDILDDSGLIAPKRFAEVIFKDSNKLNKANAIIHPAVKREILKRIHEANEAGERLFFVEAALLIEEGYDAILDELWYIYASEDVRRLRLKESRGYTDEKIDRILLSQLSDSEFRSRCHAIIDNSGDFEKVKKSVDRLVGDIHD